jgi:GMP synthase-like glutamine amidotransferase
MNVLIIKHIEIEGPGIVEYVLNATKTPYKILSVETSSNFPKIDLFSHLIILGGPMNVYEEERYPFLKKEDLLIKEAIQKGKAVLGICLGAQLIAKALGVKIFKAPIKEIGWSEVELTDEGIQDTLFSHFTKNFQVFQWHEDTFDLPQGAKLLATSSLVPHQAFVYGKGVYALQFHLEVTEEMIREWLETYEDDFQKEPQTHLSKSQILTETEIHIETYTRRGLKFFEKFLRMKP